MGRLQMRARVLALVAIVATSAIISCADKPLAVEFNVDSAGATLSLLDGIVQFIVPPGAVDRRLTITATRRLDAPASTNLVSGSAVALAPDGLVFAVACTLSLNYQSLTLAPGMKPSTLHLRRLDETTGIWSPLGVTTVDTVQKRVTGVLNGFSTYALFGEMVLSPEADSSYPNQPAGFTMLYNRPMSALAESGWGFRDYSVAGNNVQGTNISIVNQPDAPKSAPAVLQFTYPSGFAGGGEPAKTGREFPTSEFSSAMYMSLWVRFSNNWDGHGSSVNKIVYWQMTADPNIRARLFLQGRGINNENLEVYLVTQGTPLGDQRLLPPNLAPGAQFVRGQWHRVEVVVRMNTGSDFNGQVHMWLDGTKIAQYTDVTFASAAEDQRLSGFEITPVWGGTGDQIGPQAQFLWVDHLYLSRQP
jgi:hypothetical protein